jgi:hypothetical protein
MKHAALYPAMAVLATAIGLSCPFDLRAQAHAPHYEVDLSWP